MYVTHDQVEALALADRMAVMRAGRIEQMGPPEEIFNRPETEFVAAFVGDPAMNLFDALRAADDGIEIAGVKYPLNLAANAPPSLRAGIRPADLSLNESDGRWQSTSRWRPSSFLARLVHHPRAFAHDAEIPICAVAPRRVEPGQTHRFYADVNNLHLFDASKAAASTTQVPLSVHSSPIREQYPSPRGAAILPRRDRPCVEPARGRRHPA